MSVESVQSEYPESVAAVRAFFAQFYGDDIEQTEAPDDDAVVLSLGALKKTVVVTADFLAAFDPQQIRENLAAWNIAHLTRTLERGCRLIITSEGSEEDRG